jgi:hypothetical protein
VQSWLNDYIAAWRSSDPEAIGRLFAEDATYAYRPWDTGDQVIRGRAAIVADWLKEPDQRSWAAEYRPLIVSGEHAIATGLTSYSDGHVFDNMWELHFDEAGQCTAFVEWYMLRPSA